MAIRQEKNIAKRIAKLEKELTAKKRTLEIEDAVERVSAVAMRMKKPGDLLKVCESVFNELKRLGFTSAELRNAQIAINNDEKGFYYGYQYTDYIGGEATEVPYHIHPVIKKLHDKMKKSNNAFADIEIKGRELKDWKNFVNNFPQKHDKKLNAASELHYYFYSVGIGALGISSFQSLPEEKLNILQRLRNVFNLSYQRYTDIALAEAQAKEARIEAALEKVRSRSLAMHKSEEMREMVKVVFERLKELNFAIDGGVFIGIPDTKTNSFNLWVGDDHAEYPTCFNLPYYDAAPIADVWKAWKNKSDFLSRIYSKKEKNKWFRFAFNHTDFKTLPADLKNWILKQQFLTQTFALAKHSGIGIHFHHARELTVDEIDILKRFTKVFEQGYIRFLDLQKAEAQTREAQIEVAVERVRAKALAMHRSEEISDVANILRNELGSLNIPGIAAATITLQQENGKIRLWDITSVIELKEGFHFAMDILFDLKETKPNDWIRRIWDSKEKYFVYKQDRKDFKRTLAWTRKYNPGFADTAKQFIETNDIKNAWHPVVPLSHGKLSLDLLQEPVAEVEPILTKMAAAFDLAYKRFLDLQKAEAQAREAQIEAALERVRARTMGMHQSKELHDVTETITNQLSGLSLKFDNVSFCNVNDNGSWELWISTPQQAYPSLIHLPYIDHRIFNELNKYIDKGENFFTDLFDQEESVTFFRHFFENSIAKNAPEERKQFVYNSKGFARSNLLIKNIWFTVGRYDIIPFNDEENEIIKRFAKVFEQSYTRFLDLQKAEAQVREAQIEAALERVRSKAMAMHSSTDILATTTTAFEELKKLGIHSIRCGIGLLSKNSMEAQVYASTIDSDGVFQTLVGIRDLTEHSSFIRQHQLWLKQENFVETLSGNELKTYYKKLFFHSPATSAIPKSFNRTEHGYYFSFADGMFYSWTDIPYTENEVNILERFKKIVALTFRRFLDLQKAEAQAREAQIEVGLERVRSRAMAMQSSEELNALIGTVFTELTKLDLVLTRCTIWIFDPVTDAARWWMANSEEPSNPKSFYLKYHEHPAYLGFVKEWKNQSLKWVYDLNGEDKIAWDNILFNDTELKYLPDVVKSGMKAPDRVLLSASFNNFGALNVASLEPLSDEHFDILLRFAKVFDLTYTRFNDLKQAEAQARESQIQLALERVRARTMAMQKSNELMETAVVLFNQLNQLGENIERTIIGVMNEEERVVDVWATRPDGSQMTSMQKFPIDEPIVMQKVYAAWRQQKSLVIDLKGEELESYFQFLKSRSSRLKRESLGERRVENFTFFSKGFLGVINADPNTPANLELYERFAAVFDQTYTRFLDLQKAEEQARESQIQLALERVRARTMAMQKSDELPETSFLLFQQMKELGETAVQNSIGIIKEDEGLVELSTTVHGHAEPRTLKVPIDDLHVMAKAVAAWKAKSKSLTVEFKGQELKDYNELRNSFLETKVNFPEDNWIVNIIFFSKGWLSFSSNHNISKESFQLLERFAGVFDLTYTRFLDLKQAEEQARESQIQLALERVRARTMAMQKSDELKSAATLLFQQVKALGVPAYSCGYNIWEKEEQVFTSWMSTQDGTDINAVYNIPLTEDANFIRFAESRQKGEQFFVLELRDERMQQHYEYLKTIPAFKAYFDYAVSVGFDLPKTQIHHIANFSNGNLLFITLDACPEFHDVFKRFASVFEQTYTRFLDLKKAEAQAREAQIQLALERVRARTMAMQKSDELTATSLILFQQFRALGETADQITIGIFNEDKRIAELSITYQGNALPQIYKVDIDEPFATKKVYNAWKIQKRSLVVDITGKDLRDYNAYRNSLSDVKFDNNEQDHWVVHAAFFSKGFLAFSDHQQHSAETIQILERFAAVFDLTYTRFLDLKQAEAQTREAKIEAALERVRAKAMAMHKSEDLNPAVATVFEELDKLDLGMLRCGIGILYSDRRTSDVWTTAKAEHGNTIQISGDESMDIHPLLQGGYDAWQRRGDFSYVLEGEDLVNYYQALTKTNFQLPESASFDTIKKDQKQFYYVTAFESGNLFAFREQEFSEEAKAVMKRFAGVFNLTYKRFLDLQNAEAQTREAQIEAALERVRAKAMAMHKSEDLQAAVTIMFEEFPKLNLEVLRCGVGILDKHSRSGTVWATSVSDNGVAVQISANESFDLHPLMRIIYENWQKQEDLAYVLEGEDLVSYYKVMDESQLKLPKSQSHFSEDSLQVQYYYAAMFNAGGLYAFREKPFAPDDIKIMKRFASVVDLTYKRFLDLQKAEAQAREAQIEAALERVRARTMAMFKSDELAETAAVVFKQLIELGIEPNRLYIGIINNESGDYEFWITDEEGNKVSNRHMVSVRKNISIKKMFEGWKEQQKTLSIDMVGDELNEWLLYWNKEFGVPFKQGAGQQRRVQNLAYFSKGFIATTTFGDAPKEIVSLLNRFAAVFNLTYTRFNDLQIAEAQAREAQIEASLERVRAHAMAMHNSQDLSQTVNVFFKELKTLDIIPMRCGVGEMNEETHTSDLVFTTADKQGELYELPGKLKHEGHPVIEDIYNHWKSQEEYHPVLQGININTYYRIIKSQMTLPDFPDYTKHFGNYFYFKEGFFFAWAEKELSEEGLNICRRFTTVLSLTYKRYKDLKQAEANAREAQIEAGLERVRARTMAMHSSDDVSIATATMFTELEKLGIQNLRGGITIIKPNQTQEVWSITNLPDGKTIRAIGVFDMRRHPLWRALFETQTKKEDYHYYWLAGKDKENYIAIINATPNYLSQPIKEIPDMHVQSYFFGEGSVWTNSLQPHSEDDKQVMKRFASVFSLTFRRYQDLKKAEAQAREATIEAALERVRARTMAMQKSDELPAAAKVMFEEFRNLQYDEELKKMSRGFITTINEEKKIFDLWITDLGGNEIKQQFKIDFDEPTTGKLIYQAWKNKQAYLVNDLHGERLTQWLDYLRGTSFKVDPSLYGTRRVNNFLYYSNGFIGVTSSSNISEDSLQILLRFAKVFEQTFTRFLDLQKAEASTREAIKQAALDRIRADIASMRTVSDLDRITPLIWNELTILGLPFIRCGVFIMDEPSQLIHTFLSTPDGKAIAAFHLPYDTPGNISKVIDNWRHKKIYVDHWGEEEFVQFADILMKQGALTSREQYLKTIPHGGFHLHFLPFLQGMLYVGNTEQLNEEQIELIQHVADAFSTAYARYEDFNKLEAAKKQVENTLTDLKQAQQQLVQSEKMASLGELTAGIAHEIQNPLNFVNNFSDVSNELLEEMKNELEKGNKDAAIAIVEDVKQNLEKILHHGKRADAIVKGMLQHSRTSSGQKEMTDINILADEYLRLAYHGLRAKDKTFNAKFETHFDEHVGKINVIPQDIGRVILNLINNAFYTVTEKKKQSSDGFEPTVTVTTIRDNGKIEIKVRDNGNGIPPSIKDKIFQPFFTTKPTGQGTGLGLSLAYDIITKGHGGELKVETKEGEGSEFIIQLPNQTA